MAFGKLTPFLNYVHHTPGVIKFLNRMGIGQCNVVIGLGNSLADPVNCLKVSQSIASIYTSSPFSSNGKDVCALMQLPVIPLGNKCCDTLALFNIFHRTSALEKNLLLEATRITKRRLLFCIPIENKKSSAVINTSLNKNLHTEELANLSKQLLTHGFEIAHIEPQYQDKEQKQTKSILGFMQKWSFLCNRSLIQMGIIELLNPVSWLISADRINN